MGGDLGQAEHSTGLIHRAPLYMVARFKGSQWFGSSLSVGYSRRSSQAWRTTSLCEDGGYREKSLSLFDLPVEVVEGRASFSEVWEARSRAGTWAALVDDPSGLPELEARVLARFSLKELQVTAWLPLQARWVEERALELGGEEAVAVTDFVPAIIRSARSRLPS